MMEHDDNSQPIEEFLYELTNEIPRSFSEVELKSFTSDFKTKLGFGGFGDVYKGKSSDGVKIAVKVLKESTEGVMRKQFMAEVSTMGRNSHPNLIKLYGFCFDTNMKALVFEYMKHGSLDKILFKNDLNVEWAKLYEITIEIANGLSFLHEHCRPRIVHYDIKPDNVLIDSNLSPRIIDFGMARHSSQAEQSGFRGTSGYAAPEVGKGRQVTYKSDVYSFGMMLFEILRRKRNKEGPGWFPGEVGEKVEKDELEEILLVCGIEEKDKEKAEKLCIVALMCTQQNHLKRPDMSSVVKMLQGEILLQKPPNPFPFYDSSPESSLFGDLRQIPKFSPAFTEGLPEESSHERAEDSTHTNQSGSKPSSSNSPIDPKGESVEVGTSKTIPELNTSCAEEPIQHNKLSGSSKLESRKARKSESMLESYKKFLPGEDVNALFYRTTWGTKKQLDDYNQVRSILESHQIVIEERDIGWSRNEIDVPILVVKGKLIGGADEVVKLEKEGTLRILFDGIPKKHGAN